MKICSEQRSIFSFQISLSSHKLEIKDLPIAAMRSVRVKRNEPEQLLENNVEGLCSFTAFFIN